MNILHKSTLILTIIGAINWGLYGLFQIDIVRNLFGELTTLSKIIYVIIAIAGIINIGLFFIDLEHPKTEQHFH